MVSQATGKTCSGVETAVAVPSAADAAWRLLIRDILAIVAKELRIEQRTRATASVFIMFGLLTLTTAAFAFAGDGPSRTPTGIGALWISVLFGSLLSLGRSFSGELEFGALRAVRMAPISPSALLIGKLLANFLLFAALEVVLLAAFVVFYNQPVDGRCVRLLGTLWLGTFGLCSVGTVLVAATALTQGNELLLPLLVLPLALPLVIAAVKCTTAIYEPALEAGWASLRFLGLYAVIFLAAAVVLFDFVLEE